MKIPKVNHMKNFNVNDHGFTVGLVVLMFLKFYHANVEKLRDVICGKWKRVFSAGVQAIVKGLCRSSQSALLCPSAE